MSPTIILSSAIFALFIVVSYSIKIKTKFGEIQGITASNGVHKFLNLPYAEPPIGPLRWRPTQPFKNTFTTTYNATSFGNACVQPSATHSFNVDPDRQEPIQYIEDCLYLNVYTPYNFNAKVSQSLLPVLFWIHGGGLTIGTAMVPIFDGYKLAKDQNIIVVSINYRLGRAAWFIDPLLDDSQTGNGGANGFLDMIEALKWTRDNIKSFGGDKNQVTISGESGGGVAVCALVVSPLAKGLFIKSIQMSGSCIKGIGGIKSKRDAYVNQKKTHDLFEIKTFEELRNMDMQTIVDTGLGAPGIVDGPSIDGYVFPMDSILQLLENGQVNGESVMIGTLFQESFAMPPFYMGVLSKTEADLNAFYMKYLFDSEVKEIQKYYPINELKKVWSLERSYFNTTTEIIQATEQTDCWVRCGSIAQTEIITNNPVTKHSVSVYFYQFGTCQEPYDAVTHSYDIHALFGMFEPKYSLIPLPESWVYTDEFIKVGMQFFGEYVKGIGPLNSENKPATIQNGNYLRVVEEVKVVDLNELNVVKERCKLWDRWGDQSSEDGMAICMGIEPMAIKTMMEQLDNTDSSANADTNATCDGDVC
eukprot:493524_1